MSHTQVTVYSKSACVQCNATYRSLDTKGIDYTVVDLEANPAALEYVQGLGHKQAPVVVGAGMHWSGYRPDYIAQLEQLLLDDVHAERAGRRDPEVNPAVQQLTLEQHRAEFERETARHFAPGELTTEETTPGTDAYEQRFAAYLANEIDNGTYQPPAPASPQPAQAAPQTPGM